MDELQERAEIDRLLEEQAKDDKDYQAPEFPNMIPLGSIEDQLGTQDDQIVFVSTSERGSVLVAGASWHGTLAGYAKQKCRCRPCRDSKATYERKRRAEKSA
jgi:hypothetical protein